LTTQDRLRGTGDRPPRRASLRFDLDEAGEGVDEQPRTEAGLTLPERLYAARDAKGVDLYRAERDTKIRSRYLAAMERGEWRELPGNVYAKGFLRNYALYLGLDPDEVLAQWHRERVTSPHPSRWSPRPAR
jgi:hypothetical protein